MIQDQALAEIPNVQTAVQDNHKWMRITQHGKMRHWIATSLQFFEDTDGDVDKSLTLHTLPHLIDAQAGPETLKGTAPIAQQNASLVTSVVPRLISVAEILKREYMKILETTKTARVIGLHQYNELGTLEELGVSVDRIGGAEGDGEKSKGASAEERRSQEILQALSGKNHPKQMQTPFIRITLSTVERPDLVANGASYQPPAVRKQSKTAKARAKKRAKAKRAKESEDNAKMMLK